MSTHLKASPSMVQPRISCRKSGWRAQFGCPTGWIGFLVGELMARKNARMNRFAVDVLDPQAGDQVLEIGFGPGTTLAMIADRMPEGEIAGLDLSDVMVRQAARRNLDHLLSRRMEISQGSVANLPFEYGRFNKVLAVNNYQLWPNQELNLIEVRRVLREGGTLVLTLRRKNPDKLLQFAPGFDDDEIEETVGLVRWVGFRNVHLQSDRGGSDAACVVATR
jgi:SAM-dependent methyltransferase